MLGKIKGKRRRWCQRKRWLNSITDAIYINLGKFWEMMRDREAWRAAVQGVAESRQDWMTKLLELQIQHQSFQQVLRLISLKID